MALFLWRNLIQALKPWKLLTPAVPNLSGTRDWCCGRQFFSRDGMWGGGDGFRMSQAHHIYGALNFYYYYIGSTSDHWVLDPRSWGASTLSCCCCCKSLQSCPTLSDPMDCSLPGSSVHGIFQARVLEWGAIYLIPQIGK